MSENPSYPVREVLCMQIERIEPIAIRLPLTKPMKMAGQGGKDACDPLVGIV